MAKAAEVEWGPVDGAENWTLREGDMVRARDVLADAHVYQWSFVKQEWQSRDLGIVPKGTIGIVEDIDTSLPEILVDFQWQRRDGELFSAYAGLNHERWVERLPRLHDAADDEATND